MQKRTPIRTDGLSSFTLGSMNHGPFEKQNLFARVHRCLVFTTFSMSAAEWAGMRAHFRNAVTQLPESIVTLTRSQRGENLVAVQNMSSPISAIISPTRKR